MNICDEISAGLRLLGNNLKITEECFIKLLEMCVGIIIENEENRSISQLCNSKVDVVKGVCAALLSFLVEVTRHNIDVEVLSTILSQDYNFTPARCEKLVKFYLQNRNKLQAALSNVGTHPPHIVDANWTLDYCIKTNSVEHAGVLQYLVQFHVESCDNVNELEKRTGTMKFVCSLEELQDLVGKLRDAVKHVERIAVV